MSPSDTRLQDFLALSRTVTGFSAAQLRGTGQAELYLDTLTEAVGEATAAELLEAHRRVLDGAGEDEGALDRLLRSEILSHEKLGPVARSVIKLWFVGTWYRLPDEWHEAFGAGGDDRTFVPSPISYTEGLLWPTIGANPSGAKAPGFGTWTGPPRIPTP